MDEALRSDILVRMRQASTHELLAIWNDYDLEAWTEDAFSAITAVLNERRLSGTGVELNLPAAGWSCSCGAENLRADEYCRECSLNLPQQLIQKAGTVTLTEKSFEPELAYITPKTFAHIAFSFKGRISVGVFWLSMLCLIGAGALFILAVACLQVALHFSNNVAGPIFMIAVVPFFIISLALQVKRFHDIGKSGAAFLWHFCPVIGNLVCLYFFLKAGEFSDNQYGADPLAHKRIAPMPWDQRTNAQARPDQNGVWPPPV